MTSQAHLDALARRLDRLTSARGSIVEVPVVAPPPNIIEFATSPEFLGRPLYPRQALMLKIIFLATHLLTAFDYRVMAEWTSEFARTGSHGISPDVLVRMERCRAEGRSWFREVIAVVGRRGGKGYLSAIAFAYVLFAYLMRGSPQDHYGIATDKRIALIVFGTKRNQARDNVFRDLVGMITSAPCFAPYIARRTDTTLLLYTPADLAAIAAGRLKRSPSSASVEIVARESTLTAGRGPAAFALAFDEMAHVVATGANRSAEEIYGSATPALDQFGVDSFIFEPSSPWQQTGQFYVNYLQAQEVDDDGEPTYPSKVLFQLTSWDPYEDWERAHEIEMVPGGACFARIKRPIQTYDGHMQELQQANPDTFRVERLSQFRTTINAYLAGDRVKAMFDPWNGTELAMQEHGQLAVRYKIHADPGLVNSNFAVAVAHAETDEEGQRHVVFDYIGVWRPREFPENDYEVDYDVVAEGLTGLLERFHPVELTLDQWNSAGLLQRLRRHAQEKASSRGTVVFERTATRDVNWKRAETFKAALYRGLVHAPMHELAELELRFLEDVGGKVTHPSTGPVTSSDIADCIFECVHYFLADSNVADVGRQLSETTLRGHDVQVFDALSEAGRRRPYDDVRGIPHRHRGRFD